MLHIGTQLDLGEREAQREGGESRQMRDQLGHVSILTRGERKGERGRRPHTYNLLHVDIQA